MEFQFSQEKVLFTRRYYIEDLYVIPEARGAGYGKAFIRYLASLCIERGCGRLEWACLDWNKSSTDFICRWAPYRWTNGRYTDSPETRWRPYRNHEYVMIVF